MKRYQGMKITKKWLVMMLTAVLMLSMAVPTFVSGTENNGTIKIDNAVKDQNYSIYRIFDLQSYDKDEKAYLYTVNGDWKDFIASDAGDYVTVDGTTGLVTWEKNDANGNPLGVAEFAEKALAYAKKHSITAVNFASSKTTGKAGVAVTKNADADTYTITFSNLPLGYYLVDSSLGALCSLNTTNPDVTMKEKNGQPTVDKKVQEGSDFGDKASAQIGDTVTFQTTITAQAGAENYVLYDKMTKGLKFTGITDVIRNSGASQTPLAGADYTLTEGSAGDKFSFKLEFSKDVCSGLSAGDTIVVTYTATLTKDAEIGGTNTNTNETWLKYGDDSETTHVNVPVRTYKIQLVKTDEGKNNTYNVLTGAEFELYDKATGGDAIKFIKESDGNYRIADINNSTDIDSATTTIEAGTPIIKGLDAKTYWLEEIKAPDGFNKSTKRIKIEVTGDNLVAAGVLTGTDPVKYTPDKNKSGGIQIENHAGGMLPSTGGIGTVIFYILGAALVIGAIAMLVMRSRSVKDK